MAELIVNTAVRNVPIAVGESATVGRNKVADIALFGEHGPAGDEIHGVCYVLAALDTSWTIEVPVNKKPSVVVSNRSNPSEIHPPVRPGDGPRHFYLESAELALTMGGRLYRLGVSSKPNAPLVVPPSDTWRRSTRYVLDPRVAKFRVVIAACRHALARPGAPAPPHHDVAEYLREHGPKKDRNLNESATQNRWARAMEDLDTDAIAELTGADPTDRDAIVAYLVDSGSVTFADLASIDELPPDS